MNGAYASTECKRSEQMRSKDWQLMSRRDSILRLRSREFWYAAPAHTRSHWSFLPALPMAASPNRGSLVLESARISAQRGLVDTIVNTGGNSCKKFKPPSRARSRIIFVAVPSPSLPPPKSPRFVLQLTAQHRSPSVRSGLDNCFELLFHSESVLLSHTAAAVRGILLKYAYLIYAYMWMSADRNNGRARSGLHFFRGTRVMASALPNRKYADNNRRLF